MYEQPTKIDLERRLSEICEEAGRRALEQRSLLTNKYTAVGRGQSGALIAAVGKALNEIHDQVIAKSISILKNFIERRVVTPTEAVDTARPQLEKLGNILLNQVYLAGDPNVTNIAREEHRSSFERRLEGALRDIRIGMFHEDSISTGTETGDKPSLINNTVNIGTAINSPIQQAGDYSTLTMSTTYNEKDYSDLTRLVEIFENRLGELRLDPQLDKKAKAQILKIQAQLLDEPNPVIISEAGKTLRNITEGVIGGLIAAAIEPSTWSWVTQTMARLFP